MLSEIEIGSDPTLAGPAQSDISLLDLLIVVAARRRLIFTVTTVMIVITVVICLLLPNRYTAITTILPPQENGASGLGIMSQLGGLGAVASLAGGGLGLKNPNDLQVALLKSRTVEDAMIDQFHLMERYHARRVSQAEKMFESAVDIDNGAKDGLIRISVTDRDPKFAEELANGYVDSFRKFSATLAVTEASRRRLFFEQQLASAKDNLANAEEELKKTQQKTGLIQLDSQDRAVIESVAQLRAQIAAKQVQIEGMRTYATGENPDLLMAEQELAGLRTQEEKLGATPDELMIPKGNMQQAGVEYVRKLRDVKYYETIFDLLARQYEAAKVDEARQGAMVQVVDRAVVPDHHSSPKRTLIVIGAAAFGIIVGLAWAFAAEGFTRISRDPAQRVRLETLRALLSRKKKGEASL